MIAQRVILALLVGVVAGLAVEGAQTAAIVREVQRKGVDVNVGGVSMHVAPPAGGDGQTINLPSSADAIAAAMHKKAAAITLVAIVATFLVTATK